MMEEDRLSASSNESDRDNDNDNEMGENENDVDEVMDDVDADADADGDAEGDDVDADGEDDNNDDEDGDGDGDNDADNEEGDADAEGDADGEGEGDGDADGDAEGEDENVSDDKTAAATDSRVPPMVNGTASGTDKKDESATTSTNTGTSAAQTNGQVKAENDTDANGGSSGGTPRQKSKSKSATPAPLPHLRPMPKPEVFTARLYDIVPTMAAPQSTSINAMAITPDLRYWITGGSDGYIRKYDGPGTINGKLPLTVAQRHPFVDSVVKAGILMSYWENEEPAPPGRGDQEHILSPVYSLAVQSQALWLLSGLESGGINLQSVRHDEGKRICCLQQHANAVSALTLAQDEKSVLSGSWDKNILDWDLNTGQTKRNFGGSGQQICAIELRPAGGALIPESADEPLVVPMSSTIFTNNGLPPVKGESIGPMGGDNMFFAAPGAAASPSAAAPGGTDNDNDNDNDAQASPAHESLFGGSDTGSLFGETAGDQGHAFGHDDDDQYGNMGMLAGGHDHEGGMDHSADMAMASLDTGEKEPEAMAPVEAQGGGDAMDVDVPPVADQTAPVPGDSSQQLQQDQQQIKADMAAIKRSQSPSSSQLLVTNAPPANHDPSQMSDSVFFSAAIDGTVRIWDKRVPNPVARFGTRPGVPPWCTGACWSPDGNMIYVGRRNTTVEEFDVRKAKRGWEPERALKLPPGSGAVTAVRPMMNGRHLICASHDILRLYDLRDASAFKHSSVPFLIVPGPPRAGVISSLYIDPTSRFMLSAAGTRGWEGTSTEVLIGYEINVQK